MADDSEHAFWVPLGMDADRDGKMVSSVGALLPQVPRLKPVAGSESGVQARDDRLVEDLE